MTYDSCEYTMNYTWRFLFPRNSPMPQIRPETVAWPHVWGCCWLRPHGSGGGSGQRRAEVLLKDGRVLRGKYAPSAGLAESPFSKPAVNSEQLQTIAVLDDNLRRTFVSERLVQEVHCGAKGARSTRSFTIRQRVVRSGQAIAAVGPPLGIEPFDEFGRRTFTMGTNKGAVPVIQGITELTPQWTKVEGISHVWDMRIATSTIPGDILKKILLKQLSPKGATPTDPEAFQEGRPVLSARPSVTRRPERNWKTC